MLSLQEEFQEKPVMIGFLDESSVADCSGKSRVINTPKIKTPISFRSRRLFSLFGFLSLGGKSVVRETQKCKQDDLIEFLKEIRTANYSIDIIIILDNASIHKAKRVKEFCRQNQIYLLYLPPYSPNLNPIEFCWKDVKKFLSQFYRESIDLLKIKGKAISEEFLTLRQDSYTRKWQKKFL